MRTSFQSYCPQNLAVTKHHCDDYLLLIKLCINVQVTWNMLQILMF
jgi:hypothetical protein